jgi:hypothetical protein
MESDEICYWGVYIKFSKQISFYILLAKTNPYFT